jgi:hypothetical protein
LDDVQATFTLASTLFLCSHTQDGKGTYRHF